MTPDVTELLERAKAKENALTELSSKISREGLVVRGSTITSGAAMIAELRHALTRTAHSRAPVQSEDTAAARRMVDAYNVLRGALAWFDSHSVEQKLGHLPQWAVMARELSPDTRPAHE